MTYKLKKGDHLIRKVAFLLLISLMASTSAGASTQTFNFSMKNNTGLSFENGSYTIEVVELAQPVYVKVNITNNDRSAVRNIYDSEAPITFDQIKLGASFITETSAMITIEFPDGWGAPKKYQVAVAQEGVPNIVLTKTADKTNIQIGEVVEIKIKIENTGNATAHNITLYETPSKGFTIATTFPSIRNAELEVGASQELYYALKAIESGTLKIEPANVNYDSKTSTSNPLTITVAAATQEKSNLTTVINLDKNNVTIGEQITATVIINNTGKAPAKFVRIDFTPPIGLEIIEENLKIDDNIQPGMPIERRITLKATETGNYKINLRTVYNDDPNGLISNSEPIVVTEKEGNYLYIFMPIIIILVGIVLFAIKRHKEYSY
jgi:uncharacterized repeat protein (TIGR01451 family)